MNMDRGNGPVGPSYLYEVSGAATVVGGQNGPIAGPPQNMVLPGNGVGPHGSSHGDGMHDMGGGDQNYCLRWNEYEKKYVEAFRVLRDNEYFTDVTLAADGHTVKAHRVILSACSNYFHSILKNMGPWQHPVLLLQDVRPGDLTSLMDFIYFGQVNMNQDSLDGFLKIAEKLKIKGLCDTMAAGGSNQILLPPPPPHPAQTLGLPSQVGGGQRSVNNSGSSCIGGPPTSVTHAVGSSGGMNNFENLLPRSPYSMQDSLVPLPPQPIGVLPQNPCRGVPPSSAPPAHQSPKPSRSSSTSSGSGAPPAGSVGPTLVRQMPAEPLMYVSPNKRTKYSVQPPAMSPQSILRNQLQIAKEVAQQQQQQQAQQQQLMQQQTQPQQLNMSQAHHQQQQHSQHSISTAQHISAGEHVEVKSEPMTILSTPDQDVPSSGVNVNEFMTGPHEADLTLPPLGQGISPQFMFSPEPEPGQHTGGNTGPPQGGGHHANNVVVSGGGPPVATMVTIDDSRSTLRIEGGNIMTTAGSTSAAVAAATSAISGATSNSHHIHGHLPQHLHPQHLPVTSSTSVIQQQQQQHVTGIVLQGGNGAHTSSGSGTPVDEPQDLTPAPQENMSHTPPISATSNGGGPMSSHLPPPQLPNTPISNVGSLSGIVISAPPTPTTPTPGPPLNSSTPGGNESINSPGTPTPPKKDRNSRKTCPYCHKDFHEMSLKRHIKDVHFRNQNTYVICPQCCKQYASQNSLYSHLNRVHGVKRDMMQDIQLQTVSGNGSNGGTGSANTSGNNGTGANNSGSSTGSTVSGGSGGQISVITNQHPPQQQHQSGPQGSHHHHGHHLSSPQQSGAIAAHQQHQQPHVVHADNSHDGIMDLAHHSDSSN